MSQQTEIPTPGENPGEEMHQDAPECTTSRECLKQPTPDLNEKQLAAIELIAGGKSYTTAAATLQIERSTLFRWRQQPHFQERLQARVNELWGDANERLKSMVLPSLEVLAQQLEDRYDMARWRAANLVLRLAHRGISRDPADVDQT